MPVRAPVGICSGIWEQSCRTRPFTCGVWSVGCLGDRSMGAGKRCILVLGGVLCQTRSVGYTVQTITDWFYSVPSVTCSKGLGVQPQLES